MNVQDRLAETLYQRRCTRCNAVQGDNKKGWRRNRVTNEWGVHVTVFLLCPACVTDHDHWMDTPPEIPSSDTLSGTPDQKGDSSCPPPPDQPTTPNS